MCFPQAAGHSGGASMQGLAEQDAALVRQAQQVQGQVAALEQQLRTLHLHLSEINRQRDFLRIQMAQVGPLTQDVLLSIPQHYQKKIQTLARGTDSMHGK